MVILMPQALVGLSEWLGGAQECAARLAEGWREGQYLQYMPGPFWIIVVLTLLVLLLPILLQIWGWTFWVALSAILGISRTVFCVFTVLHILVDVWMISVLKTCYTAYRVVWGVLRPKAADSTRHRLFTAKDRKEFEALAEQVDKEDGASDWRADNETDLPQAATLKSTIAKLDECLQTKDTSKLIFILLNGLLKRNHLGIDERALHNRALSGTKHLVEQYDDKVVECIKFLVDCEELSREEKMLFVKKARKALGQTALLLSGGGSISMYHAGVVRALIDEGLYKYIRAVSGASGGSIIAGMVAIHTETELMDRVLVKEVSTDFKRNGEMKRRKIVWFPPILDQAKHFLKHGILIDNKEFQKTCEFYYGSYTFQEAFERTHKHVCISVAASTLGSQGVGGPRRILLNHISTPNVLIRSAVAASCALPGIMHPNYLQCKDERGQVVPFEMDGVQYVDGSLQADLPFRRISTLFAVSHFIVSQVNFHVVPFLRKTHSPAESSFYWRLFRYFDSDIRHRVTSLAELGLLPRVFGQDLSGIFRQSYSGHVTLTPRFRMSEMIGLKAFQNPTEAEMEHYILNGMRSVWPHLQHIKHNTRIERTLTDAISKVRRMSYYSALGHPNAVSSPTRPLNGNGGLSLQYAVLSGGNGAPPPPPAQLSSSNNGTPRTGAPSNIGMLPPLAPNSNASSRCSTPRRNHRDDGLMAIPPPLLASALRRSDSGRFDDDDADMLESAATTPSSSARAAAAMGLPPGDGGNPPLPDGTHQQQQQQRFVRSPGPNNSKLRQLQAENHALRERVALLQLTMENLLKHTELGLFQHNDSISSGFSDYPTSSISNNDHVARGGSSSSLAPSSSPVLSTSDTDDEVEVSQGPATTSSEPLP